MYAIVRSGGKQHKVAVGDVFSTEKVLGEAGTSVTLPVLLIVDGAGASTETTTGADVSGASVTAEVVEQTKGPKIRMIHYKNKTGYKRRQGHRQPLTLLRVTDIAAAGSATSAPSGGATTSTEV